MPSNPSLILILFFILSTTFSSKTYAEKCHPDDKSGLLAFKSGIKKDPFGTLSSWKAGTDCCTWTGVKCSGPNFQVATLDLNIAELSGPLPDVFDHFPYLQTLVLSHNQFSGKFPASISTLAPKLVTLNLGFNNLEGNIPKFLGTFHTLETLDLSWNSFTGPVPRSFASLAKLSNLDLSHNQLIDPFPEMNVKAIRSLDLSNNKFHLKQIPKWVTSSPVINSLKLLNCGVAINLDNWNPAVAQFYEYIGLSNNAITGSPIKLLSRTSSLIGFYADGNSLKFDFETLKLPKKLGYLSLSNNLIYGKVPQGVAQLFVLLVNNNQLCGRLPEGADKFHENAYSGNKCLCGPPLSPCSKA